MPLTAIVSVFLFGFHLSLAFFLDRVYVSADGSVATSYLDYSLVTMMRGYQTVGKPQQQK
jgi:hypothetical protein